MRADWFTDTATAYKGKCIYYMHTGFSSIYEHEFEYAFENSMLKTSVYFDNSLSTSSRLTMYQLVPASVINSLFNRAILPAIDEKIRLIVDVEVTKIEHVGSTF
ncbi:hypothetical protein ACFSQ3_04110 [Sphingobacterium corticis]|uniref:Uncharacterized protein n=1 Tax=Sphingobacterium corticis TaxID=1812823 RepID=A0ABW5NG43_9SPHI